MMNWYHKIVVFVPGCLLCPSLQAGDGEKNRTWPKVFWPVWEKYPVNLVQMPCPEVTFPDDLDGLGRKPHGIQYYETLKGFRAHCSRLALETVNQLLSFRQAGYTVAAIVGVEHSPTCAVSYMYTRQGTIRRAGLYLDILMDMLTVAGVDIAYIGVNRRFPHKAVRMLEHAILATIGGDLFSESGVQQNVEGT